MSHTFTSVDEYITLCDVALQPRLIELRNAIHAVNPNLKERISYNMPTFSLKRNICHFAVFKNHIGFYPTPKVIEAFSTELEGYKTAKGSVQFPLSQSLPYDLIKQMVRLSIEVNA